MNQKENFKLGVFVCIALLFLTSLVGIFGFFEKFKDKARLFTTISESVQGLSVGSAVKYQGVPIGTVEDISILTKDNQILVSMQIDLHKFKTFNSQTHKNVSTTKMEFANFIRSELENGLYCLMELDGITGSKYIELICKEDKKKIDVDEKKLAEFGIPVNEYVPSEPSKITSLLASVTSIAQSLERIDYEDASLKFNKILVQGSDLLKEGRVLIENMNKTIESDKVQKSLENIQNLSSNLDVAISNFNQNFNSEKIGRIADSTEKSIQTMHELMSQIQKELQAAKLEVVSTDIRQTLSGVKHTARILDDTLSNVNSGIGTIVELLQYFDANPQFILRGKRNETEKNFSEK